MKRNQGKCIFIDDNTYTICEIGLDCSYSYLGCGEIRERGIAVFEKETFVDIVSNLNEMMYMFGILQYTLVTCNDGELTKWLCHKENVSVANLTFQEGIEQFAKATETNIKHIHYLIPLRLFLSIKTSK